MIKQVTLGILCVLMMLTGSTTDNYTAGAAAPFYAETVASDFTLKDQYDNLWVYRFPRNKVTVLAFGDREGSEQIESWVTPLYGRYQERVDIHGVAVLGSVPSMARGIVRRIVKSQTKQPVMLDWSGAVAKKYDYTGDGANIVVIDRSGKILLRAAGAADDESLRRVYGQIDKLIPK